MGYDAKISDVFHCGCKGTKNSLCNTMFGKNTIRVLKAGGFRFFLTQKLQNTQNLSDEDFASLRVSHSSAHSACQKSFHHKSPRGTTHGDEIHAIGQITHIDLVFLGCDFTLHHGLADGVHDAIGFHW